MLLFFPNETHRSLVFLDTEFHKQKLIQVSMIIYEQVYVHDIPLYLLKGSINVFIENEIDSYFTRYTHITQGYLDDHAIPEMDAIDGLNDFLKGYKTKDTLYIAHGVKQDLELLRAAGIDTSNADSYCTYEKAKGILNRCDTLKLIDICNEAGYFADQHDAYTDAKNVVHAFSHLKLVEAIRR